MTIKKHEWTPDKQERMLSLYDLWRQDSLPEDQEDEMIKLMATYHDYRKEEIQ